MGLQFVDLNKDGHLDILTATFDGSAHASYGSAEGFGKDTILKDGNDERVLISSYWDYEAKRHTETGRTLGVRKGPKLRCISALAYDWNSDGVHDLLLGSYEDGRIYWMLNEGSDAAPKYSGRNRALMAEDMPLAIPEKMTAPRLIDWDGDGDLDLVAGSFGDSYGPGQGGGLYLCLDERQKGAKEPSFGALRPLLARSPKKATRPQRPDAGLYVDVADADGDGDLDLLVGGYSMWQAELTEELLEQRRALSASLEEAIAARDDAQASFLQLERAATQISPAVRAEHRERLSETSRKVASLEYRLTNLGRERQPFVWFYERL